MTTSEQILILFSCFFSLNLLGQAPDIQTVIQNHQTKSNRVHERDADVFIVDSVYCYQRDQATGQDIPVSRVYNLEYSDMGLVFEDLLQTYDAVNQTWVNSQYTTKTFDGNDELIENLVETWDGSDWVNSTRTLNTINTLGDVEEVLNQTWDNGAWVNVDRNVFTYDMSNNNDKLLYDIWSGTDWEPDFQIFFAYNTENQRVASIFQKYLNGSYVNINRTFISYFDNTDLISEESAEVWDATNSEWLSSSRLSFDYDSEGNQLSRLREAWNAQEEIYVNAEITEDTYSSEGYNAATVNKTWNGTDWVNNNLIQRTFDEDGNLKIFRFSFWQNDAWVEASHCEFFCTLIFVDNVDNQEKVDQCSIPNPFLPGQYISCTKSSNYEQLQLEIIDPNGKTVLVQPLDQFIDGSKLQNGWYIFQIKKENLPIQTEKIIVQQ